MRTANKVKLLCVLLSLFLSSSLVYADHEKISLQLKWKHQFQFSGYYMAVQSNIAARVANHKGTYAKRNALAISFFTMIHDEN